MLKFVAHTFSPSAATCEAIAAMHARWPLTPQDDANQILIKVFQGKLPVTDASEILREYTFALTPEFATWLGEQPHAVSSEIFDYLLVAGIELRQKLLHLHKALSAESVGDANHPFLVIRNWDFEMEAIRPIDPTAKDERVKH